MASELISFRQQAIPVVSDCHFKQYLSLRNHLEVTYKSKSYFPSEFIKILDELVDSSREYAECWF